MLTEKCCHYSVCEIVQVCVNSVFTWVGWTRIGSLLEFNTVNTGSGIKS